MTDNAAKFRSKKLILKIEMLIAEVLLLTPKCQDLRQKSKNESEIVTLDVVQRTPMIFTNHRQSRGSL